MNTDFKDRECLTINKHDQKVLDCDKVPVYLKKLRILGNKLSDGVSNLDRLVNLVSLDLYSNRLTSEHLRNIRFPSSITYLNLSNNKFTDLSGVSFPDKLINLEIKRNYHGIFNSPHLNMSGTEFPDTLKELVLDGTVMDNFVPPKNLRTLSLIGTYLDAPLVFPESLRVLDLSGNREITSEMLTFPEKLKILRMNRCRGCDISALELPKSLKTFECKASSVFHFGEGFFPKSLKSLDLRDNDIEYIDLSGYTKLISLNISSNRLERIEGLADLTKLRTLNISENSITYDNFEGLSKCTNLKSLIIDNIIVDEDIQTLQSLEYLEVMEPGQTRVNCKLTLRNMESVRVLKLRNMMLERDFVIPEKIRLLEINQCVSEDDNALISQICSLKKIKTVLLGAFGLGIGMPTNEVFFGRAILQQNIPESVRVIGLQRLNLDSDDLKQIKFPKKLRNLLLYGNRITTINDIDFPANLRNLNLNDNPTNSLEGVHFPLSMSRLWIGGIDWHSVFNRTKLDDFFCPLKIRWAKKKTIECFSNRFGKAMANRTRYRSNYAFLIQLQFEKWSLDNEGVLFKRKVEEFEKLREEIWG